jgi:predicted RNA-binding Zn ribbon-like protein
MGVKPPNSFLPGTIRETVSSPRIDFVHPALDLVNSQHGRGPDLLEDDWFDDFLAHWGFAPPGRPRERERKKLLALRGLMRRIVETLDEGDAPSAADLARLDRFLRGARFSRVLERSDSSLGIQLVPARRDWAWVLSELAFALSELLARGEVDRIKVCDNVDCRFAFYDASKNRSRRWCAHTTCGNRHKVKQFRARRREAARGEGNRYSASR